MPSTWCIALFWLVAAASVWLISRNDDNRRSSLVLLRSSFRLISTRHWMTWAAPAGKEFCREHQQGRFQVRRRTKTQKL
jgi:hypothetical protein